MMINKVKSRVLILMLVMALTVTGMAMPAVAYAETSQGSKDAETEEALAGNLDTDAAAEEVADPVSIEDATVEGVQERYVYTGDAIKPVPVVKMPADNDEPEAVLSEESEENGTADEEMTAAEDTAAEETENVLVEGVDYTTRYIDGNGKEVEALLAPGQYQVVIEGQSEYDGTYTIPVEIFVGEGWNKLNGEWYYYKDENTKLTNGWAQSGTEWCWMGSDGRIVRNKWLWTGGQWYFLKANGFRASNEWAKDSVGWMWMDGNGRITGAGWHVLNGAWYYIKSNGYRADNEWTLDSAGWMWMDGNGRITTNRWIMWCGVWYYLKLNGYMAANEWAMDSSRAYWMDGSGKLTYLKEGARYVWGASGPNSFDCSGFTMYYMKMRGYNLPHNAAGQYNYLRSKNIGTNWHNAKPGDLVFYSYGGPSSSHHVGIYVGNGKLLHASSSHGKVVVTSVTYTNGHIAAICRP